MRLKSRQTGLDSPQDRTSSRDAASPCRRHQSPVQSVVQSEQYSNYDWKTDLFLVLLKSSVIFVVLFPHHATKRSTSSLYSCLLSTTDTPIIIIRVFLERHREEKKKKLEQKGFKKYPVRVSHLHQLSWFVV